MTTSAGSVVGPKWTNSRAPGRVAPRSRLWADIAGVSPALVLYGVFIVIPMAFALFLSFTKWNVIGSLNWVGFANWSRFFSDPLAHHSLLVTFELAGLSWLVQTPLAMALGIFVAGTQRYRAFYSALYILPLLDVDRWSSSHVAGGVSPDLWRVGVAWVEPAPQFFEPELARQ